MKKCINDKINNLRNGTGSQEELMKALAQIDQLGELTDDVKAAVNGGGLTGSGVGPIIGIPPTAGMWLPTPGDSVLRG